MASSKQIVGAAAACTGASGMAAPVAARTSMRRSAAAWSGFGFVAGTLFWSALGTGPGLSLALLGPAAPEQTSAITAPGKLPERLPATAAPGSAAGSSCIALVLDRAVRQIRTDPCPAEVLVRAQNAGRQDRLRPSSPPSTGAEPAPDPR
ncbi:MAG: hypothetical protein KJZ80_14165 [Hyphomicrobiaceae bacterium]|nr:hypothetical protein [Hyphomicrobiaceae bacterium]